MAGPSSRAPGARSTRRRGAALEQAARDAVLMELAEVGYAALTMEQIGRRAGTGKAPLYRRWPTKEELILSALEHLPVPEPHDRVDTGDLRGDLVELLAAQAQAMARPAGRGIYRLILELVLDRSRHPDLTAAVLDKLLQPRLTAITDALHRAARRGQIRPHVISELVTRTGPALVVAHQLQHDNPPTRDDITAIVDRILIPALTAATS